MERQNILEILAGCFYYSDGVKTDFISRRLLDSQSISLSLLKVNYLNINKDENKLRVPENYFIWRQLFEKLDTLILFTTGSFVYSLTFKM